jgi:chromosome segregation ATPase
MLSALPKLFSLAKYLPVALLIGGAGYGAHMFVVDDLKDKINSLSSELTTVTQRAETLESAAQVNQDTIRSLQNRLQQQTKQVKELTEIRQNLTRERDQYLSIFRRHDLTQLSRAKPGLIEPRINSGTEDVFRQLEQDSRELHNAQDPNSDSTPDSP